MQSAVDVAVNDTARLAALHATGLLDTDSEESFDRLTRIAAQILRTPVSLVSLVDGHRQFFKSAVGLEEPLRSQRETPIEYSFCRFAVASRQDFIVNNAKTNPLVAENPAISAIGVLAYAGVPLFDPDGHVLGAFCVVDNQPRDWTSAEIEVLEGLAAATMGEIALRQAKRELQLQEQRFRALVQNAPDIAAILERDGIIRFVSPAIERILGVDPEHAQGRNVFDMIHPDEREALRNIYADMLQQPGPRSPTDLRMRHANGHWVDLEVALSNRIDEESIRGIVANARDVTERNRSLALARESAQRLATLVETMGSGMMVLDPDGKVTFMNHAAEKILGMRREPTIVLDFRDLPWKPANPASSAPSDLWPPRSLAEAHAVLKNIELVIERDGELTFVSLNATGFALDGDVQGLIVTFSDVTERKLAEDELRLLNDVKSQFVSIVSHEFRTALTGIQGFSELIRDEDFPVEQVKDYANDINEDARRLNRMIGDMLDIDRIESGKMRIHREHFSLDALVTELVEKWRTSTRRDIAIMPGDEVLVTADRDKVTQSIANLLSNAVKYSSERITVTVGRSNSLATVSVADTGPGIPADELESIFDRYARTAKSEKAGSIGTGLGLSLVRQIARLHGGNAWAESVQGKGATFFFTVADP